MNINKTNPTGKHNRNIKRYIQKTETYKNNKSSKQQNNKT